MLSSFEACCIVCHRLFCCGDCRWKHEQADHGLQYNCPLCRGLRFFCKPKELNQHFLLHLAEEHLPLQCRKCNKIFDSMEDLTNINQCTSISELVVENAAAIDVEEKFDYLYEKVNNGENYEGIILVNKSSKTAVVTPVVRRKHLVDYESSDNEEEEEEEKNKMELMNTPHPKLTGKSPKLKKHRAATPHVKKLLSMMQQKAIEEYEVTVEEENNNGSPKTTPSRNENNPVSDVQKEMTTPTSQMPHLLKLAQIVTTSTPTHPLTGGWTMFPEQGADSPLSEIENAESPAQSIDNEPSKSESETIPPKPKSIIITGSRIRLGSQDSSEKHVTFLESTSVTDASLKKKVKFAEDTVFEQEQKVKRVFRKPKRMLTPGPQRPKFCNNPRFQALINRFESQGMIMARTPVHNREKPQESTPPVGEPSNLPARAINFKEESPVVEFDNYSKESNDLYKTCIDSPDVNNAITALTANIAGSLQSCLHSALRTTEENTEIQFKFVITKKKFSVRRITEDGEAVGENCADVGKNEETNKENIWSSVARAVKKAFWGDQGTSFTTTTPHRSLDSINSSGSSASKRKIEDTSDSELSPLNHKRHKYEGRIRGRPPLRRNKPWIVSTLRTSQSAEQQRLMHKMQDDTMNLSF